MAVIYLTGAPASGKSTLSRNLERAFPKLIVFAYSEQLRDHLASKNSDRIVNESDIRRLSSQVVTPQDIEELDRKLIDLVRVKRDSHSILIDSHAVTKEAYGFRVTSFSSKSLQALNPDIIVCLYASSNVVVERIRRSPMGRPIVTHDLEDLHTHLQTSLAVQYGILLGKPVYLIDGAATEEELVKTVLEKARLSHLG